MSTPKGRLLHKGTRHHRVGERNGAVEEDVEVVEEDDSAKGEGKASCALTR